MAAAVVGPGGLPPPEGSTARAADDFTGEMKAGMALVGRLHADAAVLMEMSPARANNGPQPVSKEHSGRFQHALRVLGQARSGPEVEEALLLACQMVDQHLARFVGAEMEAAAALFSVLAAEADARRAMAVAAKLAHEQRVKEMAAAAAGGEPRPAQRRRRRQQRRLPLSTLVAAVKSLRTLAASAMSTEKTLTMRADGRPGRGGGLSHGATSATRLVRYLTRECDKLRGITTYSLVERNLDALMSELRSWPAGLGAVQTRAARRAPAPAPAPAPTFTSLEDMFAAAGMKVSNVGSGLDTRGATQVRGSPPPPGAGNHPEGTSGDPKSPPLPSAPGPAAAVGSDASDGSGVGGGGGGDGGEDPTSQKQMDTHEEAMAVVPPPSREAVTCPNITPPLPIHGAPGGDGHGGGGGHSPCAPPGVPPPVPANNAASSAAAAAAAATAVSTAKAALAPLAPAPPPPLAPVSAPLVSASPSPQHVAAGVGTVATSAPASESRKRPRDEGMQQLSGRTFARNANGGGAATGTNAGVAGQEAGQGSSGGGSGKGGFVITNQAWEKLRVKIDFWEWILARLNGFPRPPIITVTTLDQYLGGLPVHCWAEVMTRAGLANRACDDMLSHADFQATVEAILSRRNQVFAHHREKAGRNTGPDNSLGISLPLVSLMETPFLMVTGLPADVTRAEIATAFRPDAEVPDPIMFEEINIPLTEGIFSGSNGRKVMPQVAALLSFRSEASARVMKEAWNGQELRSRNKRRLVVRFSLGLNRGSVWIGNFGGRYLDAHALINYAVSNWSEDTVMRPVFADKASYVQSVRVTFSSCLVARNAIESLSTAYARAAGGGAINRCADSGLGLIGGVSCTILFSPLLAPLAGRSYRVGDLCGRATPPPPLPSPPRAGSSQVVGAGDGRQGNDHQDSRVVVGARSDNDAPGDSERQQGRPRSAKGGDGATDGLKQEQQQQQQPGIVGDVTAAAAAAAASVKDGSSSMTSAGRGVGSGRGGVVSAESSPSCSPAGVTASLRGADDGLGGLQPMDESDPDSNHSGGGVGAVHQERVGSAGGGSAGVQTAGGVWRAGDALVGGAAAVTGSGGNVGVGGPQEGENAQGRVPGGERGMMKAAVQQQNQKQERFHQQHQHQLQPVHGSGLGRRSPDSDRGGSFASRCSSEAAIDQRDEERYVRLLDVDSDALLQAVLHACDRVGSFSVVGWCKRRWVMDVLFERRRDAAAAVDDIDHLRLTSSRSGKPIKTLLKPADFDGRFSAPFTGGRRPLLAEAAPQSGMPTPSPSSMMAIATPVPRQWSPPSPRSADASPIGGQGGGAAAVAAAAAKVAEQVALASKVPDSTYLAMGTSVGGGAGGGRNRAAPTLQQQQQPGVLGGRAGLLPGHLHPNGPASGMVVGATLPLHLHEGGGQRHPPGAMGWGAGAGSTGGRAGVQQQHNLLLEVPAVASWTAAGGVGGGGGSFPSPAGYSQQQVQQQVQVPGGVNPPRELSPAHIQDDRANRIQPQYHLTQQQQQHQKQQQQQQRPLDWGEARSHQHSQQGPRPAPTISSAAASGHTGGPTPLSPSSPAPANGSHAPGTSNGSPPTNEIISAEKSTAEEESGAGGRRGVESGGGGGARKSGGDASCAAAVSSVSSSGGNEEKRNGGREPGETAAATAAATTNTNTTTTATGVSKPLSTHPWATGSGAGGGGGGMAAAAAAANGQNSPASAGGVGVQQQQRQQVYQRQPQLPNPVVAAFNGVYARASLAGVRAQVPSLSAPAQGLAMPGVAGAGGWGGNGSLDIAMHQSYPSKLGGGASTHFSPFVANNSNGRPGQPQHQHQQHPLPQQHQFRQQRLQQQQQQQQQQPHQQQQQQQQQFHMPEHRYQAQPHQQQNHQHQQQRQRAFHPQPHPLSAPPISLSGNQVPWRHSPAPSPPPLRNPTPPQQQQQQQQQRWMQERSGDGGQHTVGVLPAGTLGKGAGQGLKERKTTTPESDMTQRSI